MFIRPAADADVARVTHIYNSQGVATTASYDLEEVTTADRQAWLDEHASAGFPVVVAEMDGEVVGYATYGQFRVKPAYRFSVEHSVYVDGEYLGRGIGEALLRWTIESARGAGFHLMVGVIDSANTASLNLHTKLGFVPAGVWPEVGWKFGTWLNVTVMTLKLSNTAPAN